jgi:hypothetical protein
MGSRFDNVTYNQKIKERNSMATYHGLLNANFPQHRNQIKNLISTFSGLSYRMTDGERTRFVKEAIGPPGSGSDLFWEEFEKHHQDGPGTAEKFVYDLAIQRNIICRPGTASFGVRMRIVSLAIFLKKGWKALFKIPHFRDTH